MFPVTVTLHNFEQLNAVTNALGAIPAPPESKPANATPKPNAEAASKAADKVVADTAKTAEKLQGDTKPEGGGEKTYTLDDAKQLTNKVVAAGKRSEMVALLTEFGVPVSAKLQPEQVNDFCKKAEALLA